MHIAAHFEMAGVGDLPKRFQTFADAVEVGLVAGGEEHDMADHFGRDAFS